MCSVLVELAMDGSIPQILQAIVNTSARRIGNHHDQPKVVSLDLEAIVPS